MPSKTGSLPTTSRTIRRTFSNHLPNSPSFLNLEAPNGRPETKDAFELVLDKRRRSAMHPSTIHPSPMSLTSESFDATVSRIRAACCTRLEHRLTVKPLLRRRTSRVWTPTSTRKWMSISWLKTTIFLCRSTWDHFFQLDSQERQVGLLIIHTWFYMIGSALHLFVPFKSPQKTHQTPWTSRGDMMICQKFPKHTSGWPRFLGNIEAMTHIFKKMLDEWPFLQLIQALSCSFFFNMATFPALCPFPAAIDSNHTWIIARRVGSLKLFLLPFGLLIPA